jgi:hypothetical protein
MALLEDRLLDVERVPPIVSTDVQALEFINLCVRTMHARHGVRVTFDKHGIRGRTVDRGNHTLYGAFEPDISWASNIYGITAERDGEVLGVLQTAVYDFGCLTMAQYIQRFGLFYDGPKIEIGHPAFALASGIQGTAAFSGDLWVRPDLRGKTPFSTDWATYAAMINRVLAISTRNASGVFLFARERIAKLLATRT